MWPRPLTSERTVLWTPLFITASSEEQQCKTGWCPKGSSFAPTWRKQQLVQIQTSMGAWKGIIYLKAAVVLLDVISLEFMVNPLRLFSCSLQQRQTWIMKEQGPDGSHSFHLCLKTRRGVAHTVSSIRLKAPLSHTGHARTSVGSPWTPVPARSLLSFSRGRVKFHSWVQDSLCKSKVN